MKTFGELLSRVQGSGGVVVGDVMVDEYIHGKGTRVSQEAPVLVVRQSAVSRVLGGAANVAFNLRALGVRDRLIGVVGDDEPGNWLRGAVAAEFESGQIVVDPGRPTTRKTRVYADKAHQVLRIDHETTEPLNVAGEDAVFSRAEAYLSDVAFLLLSDYQKGVLTASLVRRLIDVARERGIPVIANAKPKTLAFYRGADLVSLNQPEACGALGIEELAFEDAPAAAGEIEARFGIHHVLITMGAKGMASREASVPAIPVNVFDTAGAGDTVIATVAAAYPLFGLSEAVLRLAAHTSASVVQQVGVAVPDETSLNHISSLRI